MFIWWMLVTVTCYAEPPQYELMCKPIEPSVYESKQACEEQGHLLADGVSAIAEVMVKERLNREPIYNWTCLALPLIKRPWHSEQ